MDWLIMLLLWDRRRVRGINRFVVLIELFGG
jgi:hypothetical protein